MLNIGTVYSHEHTISFCREFNDYQIHLEHHHRNVEIRKSAEKQQRHRIL